MSLLRSVEEETNQTFKEKLMVTMRDLLECGVHFGHHTRRWNPLMTPYVYGVKDKIHIINLNKTAPLLHRYHSKRRKPHRLSSLP